MPLDREATVTLSYTNKLVSLVEPRPDSSVGRASGCNPEGPGFNPRSVHFSTFNRMFSWQSHMQNTIAHSSAEAEYVVLSDCSCQVVWVHSLYEGIYTSSVGAR